MIPVTIPSRYPVNVDVEPPGIDPVIAVTRHPTVTLKLTVVLIPVVVIPNVWSADCQYNKLLIHQAHLPGFLAIGEVGSCGITFFVIIKILNLETSVCSHTNTSIGVIQIAVIRSYYLQDSTI